VGRPGDRPSLSRPARGWLAALPLRDGTVGAGTTGLLRAYEPGLISPIPTETGIRPVRDMDVAPAILG
jgi:hypothetical protein